MSSIGTTCAWPPPVAPPLMPMMGPSAGSRSATMVRWPCREKASARPTVVVDLPSPAGVGDMAETSTSFERVSVPVIRRTSTLARSEEHTSELQSRGHLVCRLLLEKKKQNRDE